MTPFAEEHRQRLQELAEIAEARKRAECPGLALEQDGAVQEPSRFRDDSTARRAQALFDFHRGIDPTPDPHL